MLTETKALPFRFVSSLYVSALGVLRTPPASPPVVALRAIPNIPVLPPEMARRSRCCAPIPPRFQWWPFGPFPVFQLIRPFGPPQDPPCEVFVEIRSAGAKTGSPGQSCSRHTLPQGPIPDPTTFFFSNPMSSIRAMLCDFSVSRFLGPLCVVP